jgi:hypothetical protein
MRPADVARGDGVVEGSKTRLGKHRALERCSVVIITYPYISIASFHKSHVLVNIVELRGKGSQDIKLPLQSC